LPIIVKPPQQPHLQFILGIVGLPWAAFSGSFAARNILGDASERLQEVLPVFFQQAIFFPSKQFGKNYRQANIILI
jgi:gamma-glutamylputrescine oxidase